MSTLLWRYYYEDDVDSFRQVLARATYNASAQTRGGKTKSSGNAITGVTGSPGAGFSTSPILSKSMKTAADQATPKLANIILSRTDVNWRDSHGITLLHHIASSTNEHASDFAIALMQLSLLDLYVQDEESGWTALHRALYFGNITIARALMDRDTQDAYEYSSFGSSHSASGLIKIKDKDGNSPFDVYSASITNRNIRHGSDIPLLGSGADDEDNDIAQGFSGDADDLDGPGRIGPPRTSIDGDQMFAFGSNKNFTLGFGDEDDRQFPERVHLTRPNHLLRRFHDEFDVQNSRIKRVEASQERGSPTQIDQLPAAVQYRPLIVQDVQLSKMHSAILTTDPEANLYICGFGSGGRLGTGDETTRFGFVNIYGGGLFGKRIVHIGLGQNHSIAISSEGELFTWGSNGYGQLGYAPNASLLKDEEPIQLLPKQVFGGLKREIVVGAAASRIHSVVHTSSSLFTFGKNEGQLGLVDSDARSLAMQNTPRKVAASLFSSSIKTVSAIDRATVCLLENHDVWVFSNYGYTRMSFPLEGFSNYFLKSIWGPRNQSTENHICKITSGGDTICAMSKMGDVFTVHVSQKAEPSMTTASTTNPAKIRGALSTPQRVWSLKKGHMAVRDVDVGQEGSIIICTESGSVWRRVKRAKIKGATAIGLSEYKAKDYKFLRVPGLTRIVAVRSNAFGAYAAIRRDFDVLETQIEVDGNTLWRDLYPLVPFHGFGDEDSDTENPAPRFWTSSQRDDIATIRRAVLTSTNLERQVAEFLAAQSSSKEATYSVRIGTTISDVRIPVHAFILEARSETLRKALITFRRAYFFTIPEIMNIEYDSDGKTLILFQGVDFITIFNFVLYLYTDSVVEVWHHIRHIPASALRHRQVRTELMKVASYLDMQRLEQAVRVMTAPPKTLHKDFERAIIQPGYFDHGDVQVNLDGDSIKVHSALMIQRCPFFEGLFQGRAAGMWLCSRREQLPEHQDAIDVDLKHVDAKTFNYVLRYLYADADEEMFGTVITSDIDAYLDLIMDVMSVANELMLDRLTQCCQKVLGQFVDTRNVCQLLNAVAPCSVTQFKDAALEYICLNLEGMLENHLLQELDEDLMRELDEVVRQNQLACLPIAKSGRAEAELIEHYPELVDKMERSRRIKIDSLSLQTRLHEREAKTVGGSKAKAAFLEDFYQSPPVQRPRPRSSRDRDGHSRSPSLNAKPSTVDLMFEMEEDNESDTERSKKSSLSRPHRPSRSSQDNSTTLSNLPIDGDVWDRGENFSLKRAHDDIAASTSPSSYKSQNSASTEPIALNSKVPWGPPSVTTSKFNMRNIMAEASPNRVSNLSVGLSLRRKEFEASSMSTPIKLSQRERKKQQQKHLFQPPQPAALSDPVLAEKQDQDKTGSSPWQMASNGPRISLKDVLGAESSKSRPSEKDIIARTPSPLTLRQTVSGRVPPVRRANSGAALNLAPTQKCSISTPDASKAVADQTPPPPSRSSSIQCPTPIQSVRHTAPPVEPSLQLSMADILSQQQMAKDIVKEAAAKRSLQEIQEEQAFQEWWDEESRKVKAEEDEAMHQTIKGGRGVRDKVRGGRNGSRGRGRGRGRGGGETGEVSGGKMPIRQNTSTGRKGRGQ